MENMRGHINPNRRDIWTLRVLYNSNRCRCVCQQILLMTYPFLRVCTGVIPTVDFAHLVYVHHAYSLPEASYSTGLHRVSLHVCVFWDEAEQDVRLQDVTFIYDAVILVCVCVVFFVYIH
jgi:hypothetical protein